MSGEVTLFMGPMYSGKTTSMCRELRKYKIARKKCVIIKYIGDTRYLSSSDGIVTHDGIEYISSDKVISALTLADVLEDILEYDIIGIDEVQFFPDAADIIQQIANLGKIVVCAGLNGNFRAEIFNEQIARLIALSENTIKEHAICHYCLNKASFTQRISDGDELIDIGSLDKYVAVCRGCKWPR